MKIRTTPKKEKCERQISELKEKIDHVDESINNFAKIIEKSHSKRAELEVEEEE